MRLLTVVTLIFATFTLSLPKAQSSAAVNACACSAGDSRAICIHKDSDLGRILKMPVTLQMNGGSGERLSAELTRLASKEIVYLPAKPRDLISLDIKDAPLWDVLEGLLGSGEVQIEGRDFSELQVTRKALATGKEVNVCIDHVSVQQAVNELSGWSGLHIRIRSGDESAPVTLNEKGITLDGIIARLAVQTGVQVTMK